MNIKTVTLYETSDGRRFDALIEAARYQTKIGVNATADEVLLRRVYKRWPETRTLLQAFQDGYQTGQEWTSSYRPDGPWISTPSISPRDREWVRYCKLTKDLNTEWLRGFDIARKEHSQ